MARFVCFVLALTLCQLNASVLGKDTEKRITRSNAREARAATGSPETAMPPGTTPLPAQTQPLPPLTQPGTNPTQVNVLGEGTEQTTQNSTQGVTPPLTSTTTTTTTSGSTAGGDSTNSDSADSANEDEAESLVDFFVNKLTGTSSNSTATAPNVASTPRTPPPTDCSLQLNVGFFCPELSQDVLEFFQYDLTLANLRDKLFLPSEMEALDRSMCPDGDWCVSAEHRKVLESEFTGFYTDRPYCQGEVAACVDTLLAEQGTCAGTAQYRVLTFLKQSMGLLCDASYVQDVDGDCFASTMEILLVSLHVLQGQDDIVLKHKEDLKSESCDNQFLLSMNKMFLCACEDCKAGQVDALSSFPEWQDFSARAVAISQKCKQNITCDSAIRDVSVDGDQTPLDNEGNNSQGYPDADQYPYPDGEYSNGQYPDGQYPPETEEEYLEDEKQQAEDFIEYIENVEDAYNAEAGANSGADAEDKPLLLYGMLALTVIVVMFFVVVAIVSYRRLNREKYFKFSRGYSQLDQDEETRMLAHAFN